MDRVCAVSYVTSNRASNESQMSVVSDGITSKMVNVVYLEVYSFDNCDNGILLSCPLDSLVILSSLKYFDSSIDIKLVLVPGESKNTVSARLLEQHDCLYMKDLPWQVTSCKLPVVQNNDTVISGICATVRHLCKFNVRAFEEPEHPEGLLGFRSNCLQAPNEVSVWTKFCEVDMVESVKDLLSEKEAGVLLSVKRFENHLTQPLKVHNVYKVLHDKNKGIKETKANFEITDTKSRICKARKWKSNTKAIPIDCDDLLTEHKFSEGPFLTLADLILFPLFYICVKLTDRNAFSTNFPLVTKWFHRVENIDRMKPVLNMLQGLNLISNAGNADIFKRVPDVAPVSLYKCDPKRSNPRKRIFTKENDLEAALSFVNENCELVDVSKRAVSKLDWSLIPDGANPFAGHLPDNRMCRKTEQLENLAFAVTEIAKPGDKIVDFCSGSGHLGILLAHLLPDCVVILLENKEQSLMRARTRVREMKLSNVYFFHCNLDFFDGSFDVGVALHACGGATDLVLEKCVAARASFVICPCCYGSLHETKRLKYPRSEAFALMPVSRYMCIGHAADQTHEGHAMYERGVQCMRIIDSDRANYAIERNYSIALSRLQPISCTPKNMLLVGTYATEHN